MRTRYRDFNEFLIEELRDREMAVAYLNEHLSYRGPKRRELLLDAVRKVAVAQGVADLARRSGVSRRTLYHAVSKTGNPTIETFLAVLDAMGVSLHVGSADGRGASGQRAIRPRRVGRAPAKRRAVSKARR